MRKQLIIGLTLGLATVGLGLVGYHRLEARSAHNIGVDRVVISRPQVPASPIEVSNYLVQERLHTSDGAGMSRMPSTPEHLKDFSSRGFFADQFVAVHEQEKAEVAELNRQGWTVALYLAGRAVLDPPLTEAEWNQLDARWGNVEKRSHSSPPGTIGQPLAIVGKSEREALPHPRQLWEIGKRALEASKTTDRMETTFGPWSVAVRTVRADREQCLTCHSTDNPTGHQVLNRYQKEHLEVGDALGVAIYLYAPNSK